MFHSRYGAAALAAALYYSYGSAGEAQLLAKLQQLPAIKRKPCAFKAAAEAVLAVADGDRALVLQKSVNNVLTCLRPQIEIVFYPQEEDRGLVGLGLWLLSQGAMPLMLTASLAPRIWDRVRR